MDYSDGEGNHGEIDEFAMFRARAHGVESEYLEMARVRGRDRVTSESGTMGQPRGSRSSHEKQRSIDRHSVGTGEGMGAGINRKRQSCRSGVKERENGESDDSHASGRRSKQSSRSGSLKEASPADIENLRDAMELNDLSSLQRTHSYRSKQIKSSAGGLEEPSSSCSTPTSSAFDRHRTRTMPPRRNDRPRMGPGSSLRTSVPDENDDEDPSLADSDRSVLRVRNFSTRTGNLINRGDSIKVRNQAAGGGTSRRSARSLGGEEIPTTRSPRRQKLSSPESDQQSIRLSGPSPVLSRNLSGPSRARVSQDYYGSTDVRDVKLIEEPHRLETGEDNGSSNNSCNVKRQARVTLCKNEDEASVIYRVQVLGSQGVGKTTLTEQLLTSEYLPNSESYTDEESSDKIVSVQLDDEESLLQFIDVPANSQATKTKEVVDANLVVYSLTDRSSFLHAQNCLQELRPGKRLNVVILVGNKQDIVRNRCISEEEGKSLATKRQCKFIEVSALLDHKVDELLVGITRQIRLRKRGGPAMLPPTVGAGGLGAMTDSSDDHFGCMQRLAMKAFRRIFRQRIVDSACDDLYSA